VRDRPQANTAPLAGSPCRGDRFPRSMQEPRPRSRHLHAGHHLANQQAPARLIPGLQSIPGFDVNLFLRHVISGSLALAFVIHTCRAHGATFPPTLTTTALDRSSSGWFAASACTAAAEGHQATTPDSSISCTTPHSESGSSTSSLLQRSWHTSGRIAIALPLGTFPNTGPGDGRLLAPAPRARRSRAGWGPACLLCAGATACGSSSEASPRARSVSPWPRCPRWPTAGDSR